jgi:MFS family permease
MNRGAFRYRDFRLLLAGGALVGFVMPMQFLTQIFWIQDRYPDRDVLYVGLIAASRGSAMLLFGLVGGAFADRFERRKVLMGAQSASFSIHALVALLMITEPFGAAKIAVLLVLTFFAAGTMAIDQPARTASTPAIVGMQDLSNGISLQMFAQQITFPLSLPLVGFLNSIMDAGAVYSLTLSAWALILPLIWIMKFRSHGEGNRSVGMLANIREGLSYTRKDPTIFAVITIVVAIQVLGMPGPATLGPVWMTKILGLSTTEFGFMAMTWGLGTLAASIFYLFRSDLPAKGMSLWLAAAGFAACAIVFAHSRYVPLTALVNFGLGFAMVSTMVSSSTIVQQTVSEAMRGRVMGLFPLAMGLSMLGGLPVSAFGQWLGLPVVFPILAWSALLTVLVVMFIQPGLRLVGRRMQQPVTVQ